jgi:hypothetical protein
MLIKNSYFLNFKFFQTLFLSYLGLEDLRRLSKNKLTAGRSAGSPQSGYPLEQLAPLGFRGSKLLIPKQTKEA